MLPLGTKGNINANNTINFKTTTTTLPYSGSHSPQIPEHQCTSNITMTYFIHAMPFYSHLQTFQDCHLYITHSGTISRVSFAFNHTGPQKHHIYELLKKDLVTARGLTKTDITIHIQPF